jgi:hypothetical protein
MGSQTLEVGSVIDGRWKLVRRYLTDNWRGRTMYVVLDQRNGFKHHITYWKLREMFQGAAGSRI